jgi:hypothetical protein
MQKNKHEVFDVKLDVYEQEISNSIDQALEKGPLKSVVHAAEELIFAKEAAANFLHKKE